MIIYNISWDTTNKIILLFVIFFILFGIGFLLYSRFKTGAIVSLIGTITITIICYLYSINCYQLNSMVLVIKRPISIFNKEIYLDSIKTVESISKNDMDNTIRTFGIGGLFSYTGRYHNERLGDFTMYATNKNNLLLIILKDSSKLVISPDDTAAMIAAIRPRLGK